MMTTTPPTITKTEARSRLRYIRGGQWDDAVLVFHDGTSRYARACRPNGDDLETFLMDTTGDRHAEGHVTIAFPLAAVARVIR